MNDTNSSTYAYSCSDYEVVMYTILFTDWCLSALFLWITVGIYFILRKTLKLHGTLQFALSISLAIMDTSMLVKQVNRTRLVPESLSYLYNASYWCHQFATYAAFAWLSALNIEMWKSFRCFKTMVRKTSDNENPLKGFFSYFTCATGGSLLVTGMHYLISIHILKKKIVRPKSFENFTMEERCSEYITPSFSKGTPPKVVLIFVFFLLNTFLFLLTVLKVKSLQKNHQFSSSVGFQERKHRYKTFVRLFWVMGIPFVVTAFDCLLAFLPDVRNIYTSISRPITALLSLQGVGIFFISVCNKATWLNLKKSLAFR